MADRNEADALFATKRKKQQEEQAEQERREEMSRKKAEMEAEIAQLDEDEKAMFLSDMGLEKSGLDRLIKKSYSLLGLISYLTAGQPEVRAWTITKGTKGSRQDPHRL